MLAFLRDDPELEMIESATELNNPFQVERR